MRIKRKTLYRSFSQLLCLLLIVGFSGNLLADKKRSSGFDIDRAKWDARKDRLEVRGDGGKDQEITVMNAATGEVLGTVSSDDDDWRFRLTISDDAQVPCRVSAVRSSDGKEDDKSVRGAPRNCDDGSGGTPNEPPTANANGPYSAITGSAIDFSSTGSSDSDGTIASYDWDFGDGNNSSSANPSHTYAGPGSYTVTLTVTDNDGASDSDTTTATVEDDQTGNEPPTANANGPYNGMVDEAVNFSSAGSSDPENSTLIYAWDFGDGNSSTEANPMHTYTAADSYTVTLTVTDADGASDSDSTTALILDDQPPPPVTGVSINSTSQNGVPTGTPVPEQPLINSNGYRVFAINDLGMHCGDFDTRISSILPPFNVLHATVIERGQEPNILGRADGVEVYYSAASNPDDPILTGVNSAGSGPVYSSRNPVTGEVFKTNFWDVARDAYAPFYPAEPFFAGGVLSLFYPDGPVEGILDLGLPMPNVELFYLTSPGTLEADQQSMPGRHGPYVDNAEEMFEAYVVDQPFFMNPAFQFGYVKEGVNWFEAPGVPVTAFDDDGRENPWPLYRIQAKVGGNVVASVDTVVPISGEANCGACHGAIEDGGNGAATSKLTAVATAFDDDPQYGVVPLEVSKEYAADLNLVRLHDIEHGTDLENQTPVVCQQCHYTPALDLAQLGPLDGDVGTTANGRRQASVKSMSNVMHSHHGSVTDGAGDRLFPEMPAAIKDEFGIVANHDERRQVLEETCYQCHPGRRTDCLRGAMSNGGMLCQDCHGNMDQVGDDFTRGVSPTTPGAFELGGDFYTNADQPRVPWANEPGCGSCHTGDAMSNLVGTSGTVVNPADTDGNEDNIRLFQAYRSGDAKATPIVPTNKRFAENVIEADNPAVSGLGDPRIGNPMLYRVSTGHEGVFCEACHGSTHGIWPNKNELANDNVAANQLQGHKGTIVECSTCHEGDLGNTLGGPHGMHPVGDTDFADGGHSGLAERSSNECRACHGDNGQGTVLSRMATDRVLQCDNDTNFCPDGNNVLFPKGHTVGCTECHENEL
ncbi:MAG: PKD domain-containing protein [Candidatus Thiodiazotropha sp. (ex Lucinoma borealis)]|nr:PKD domain-containing protein [Candidatus Thiodiazotropha sp. (ex Lucinoma borealis)]MCU7867738.1 PKD domain-containing protein [Candidatus Thiodiazotropha sp. (ex Lucinoma borealis)]